MLSRTLREINIPLSDEHFEKCETWQARVDGKTIIDSTFHLLAPYSPEYVKKIEREIQQADIAFFLLCF